MYSRKFLENPELDQEFKKSVNNVNEKKKGDLLIIEDEEKDDFLKEPEDIYTDKSFFLKKNKQNEDISLTPSTNKISLESLKKKESEYNVNDFYTIDWVDENTKERYRKEKLRELKGIRGKAIRFWEFNQVWFIIVATGISIGVISGFIDIVSGWLSDIREGYCKSGFYLNHIFCCWIPDDEKTCSDWISWGDLISSSRRKSYIISYIFYVIIVTLFGGISSFLVINYAHYAKESGISEIKTILSGFVMHNFFGKWILLIKSLSVCFSIASGLWIGKEGPLIHIACCFADLFFKIFSTSKENQAKRREILSAAAAAGTSVAFGAPIGGVLFTLEQLSYYFPDKTMWKSFVCAMIGAMSLKFVNPFRDGRLVIYQAFFKIEWYSFELIPISLLGIIGGLYGHAFIKLNEKILKFKYKYQISRFPIQEVLIVVFITGLVNYSNIFMKSHHYKLLAKLFQKCNENDALGFCLTDNILSSALMLLLATIFGTFLCVITFGLQVPSGIILPSMVIGALYGRLIGIIIQYIQHKVPSARIFSACKPGVECVAPEIYSIIGAVSALAGVTRMTVSLVIIMFELTGALTYLLPIIIAVVISKWVGDAFGKYGIYENWIYINNYPYLSKELDIKHDTIENYITKTNNLVTITAKGHTIKTLELLLKNYAYRGFPVINNSNDAILIGYISQKFNNYFKNSYCYFTDTQFLDPSTYINLGPWMNKSPFTLSPKSTIHLTTNLFQKLGIRLILFTTNGQLQGLITKKDLIKRIFNT
ncbi:hypothetical protein PNEG_00194 [Pneumocystis murina B123]|uniref:Chloride channel protein n=1 Tax=Pneumocystis murina (strain B123) TaxID=1069680 RepID=M7NWW7_PNEMU|nr:hypothetical protein PNEG_00194 [Pneumocystis murina B123]EMR11762.1 hypothetical protein PNEG_00194 [Pneumocystis murina B123]